MHLSACIYTEQKSKTSTVNNICLDLQQPKQNNGIPVILESTSGLHTTEKTETFFFPKMQAILQCGSQAAEKKLTYSISNLQLRFSLTWCYTKDCYQMKYQILMHSGDEAQLFSLQHHLTLSLYCRLQNHLRDLQNNTKIDCIKLETTLFS